MLKTPNCYIEMWRYQSPRPSDRVGNPQDLGYLHIAFQVEGIDSEVARLTALGMVFVGPAQNFGDISEVNAPIPLEISLRSMRFVIPIGLSFRDPSPVDPLAQLL